ncbi:hypothetical protein TIFTF001_025165 [Ficus carica]|uniref:Uncharacterized protein n=1 Tax=Ficus carica TaxID=3494 RepID=A0AA88ANB1_FICCA|nr:hypothetical protein TIFTF001_025165 [Ficus carica]
MGATMKSLQVQIGQLANSIKGQSSSKFPSDTETKEHCKDSCVKEFTRDVLHNDPLEHCLLNSSSRMDFSEEYYAKDEGVVDYVLALEALPIEDLTA